MGILNFICDNWTVIGSTTVLSTLFSLFLRHLLDKNRLVFKSALDEELEKLKSNLIAHNNQKISELDIQLEKAKSELQLQNSRLQIAYSGILENQITALKGLYQLILEFEVALRERKSNKDDYEAYIRPNQVLDGFKQFYYEEAIFIPESLDNKIREILGFGFKKSYSDLIQEADNAARNGEMERANELRMQSIKDDLKLYELRDSFIDEIRKVLGLNI